MQAFTSDHFVLPLPAGHRFPMSKYARLRQRVEAECGQIELLEAPAATQAELAVAHDPAYIARVGEGRLSATEVRAIGFPWSAALAERARRSVGATIAASRAAIEQGCAANLAGGTHHAQRGAGSGYCVFNDVAVAARVMQAEHKGTGLRVAIIDLDVHQGDGTAQIFAGDDSVFTLSIHAKSNFPARKQAGSLDIGLPDGTGDADYLAQLDKALATLASRFEPELILYVAGADPHCDDRLGRLKLSVEGLAERDQRVFDFAARTGASIAVTMAGGYGRDVEVTVGIHLQTLRLACSASSRIRTARGEHA